MFAKIRLRQHRPRVVRLCGICDVLCAVCGQGERGLSVFPSCTRQRNGHRLKFRDDGADKTAYDMPRNRDARRDWEPACSLGATWSTKDSRKYCVRCWYFFGSLRRQPVLRLHICPWGKAALSAWEGLHRKEGEKTKNRRRDLIL